jgi:hypothetical protein
MISIRDKPIPWRLTLYCSQCGNKEFGLRLGYKANVVKESSAIRSRTGACCND